MHHITCINENTLRPGGGGVLGKVLGMGGGCREGVACDGYGTTLGMSKVHLPYWGRGGLICRCVGMGVTD